MTRKDFIIVSLFVLLFVAMCAYTSGQFWIKEVDNYVEDNNIKVITPIKIKVSYYTPLLADDGSELIPTMANGEYWREWFNKNTVACPIEFAFGTKVIIGDRVYTCKDRGILVVKTDSYYLIDILTNNPPYPYGTIIDGYYFYP